MLFESSKSFWHILVHTILNNHKTPDTSNMDFFGWTNTEYIMKLYYTTFLQMITAAENFWYNIQDKFCHFATEWIFFYLKKVREKACDFSSFLKNPFCTHVCIIEIPFSHERFCSIAKYVHISTIVLLTCIMAMSFFLVTYVEYSLMYLVPFLQMK